MPVLALLQSYSVELMKGILMKRLYSIIFVAIFLTFTGCTAIQSMPGFGKPPKDNVLDYRLNELTNQIIVSLSQQQKSKIAVIEFSDLEGNITQFGRYVAEELITRLFRTGKFEVIERQLLRKVLQEHELRMSGIVDEHSAKELGRILGVDAIATGSVSNLGSSVKINARLISTETGKIFAVAAVNVKKDEVIAGLMGESPGMASPDHSSPVSAKTPQSSALNMVENNSGFEFKLLDSKKENRTVTCDFQVTNTTEDDLVLDIYMGRTKIFDNTGNEYIASQVKIANKESKLYEPGKTWSGAKLTSQLIPGIPTPVQIIFQGVSSTTNSISLLELKCAKFNLKYRNIPLKVIE